MSLDLVKADEHFIHVYNRAVCFVKGEDVYLYDDEGKKYLDFTAGIAVNALGYSNDELKNGIKDQVDKILHTSNLYFNEPAIKASKYIADATGLDKVFFTNSGAEAIEGALKLARRYAYDKNPNSKGEIIAMNNSFHGRTMGSLSVTGTEHYRTPFEPLIGGVKFANYNDLDSVKALITDDTCAIIMETVQGEGGLTPANEDFIKGVRKLCDENDIAMILDEIQCGMGRTGYMYAYQKYGVKPDIVTTAKALGCGVPVGAFVANAKFALSLVPGDHGTTYGGNPLATAAVCKVYEIFEKENILDHVNEIAEYFDEALKGVMSRHSDKITGVRGTGLMRGLAFSEEYKAADVVKACLDKGVVVIIAGGNVLRMVPPLVIKKEHVDELVKVLDEVL
ncbi:MAG: aspartate aminotransferase family protein [Lachnospiraceae bacterium]|nr:aspartate aminotransferase family protein [Lachnospiraceae bacterium]